VATGGSGGSLIDTTQNWAVNQWAGMTCLITSGTGVGHSASIVSNTATTLTIYMGATPDTTSHYIIGQIPTADGTHPNSYIHQALSVPVATLASTMTGK
jgi:hypothetical protein